MSIEKADLVRSVCGRDQGELFMVAETAGEYAYIVNGRSRRLEKPKKKKLKHLEFVERNGDRVAEKLRSGEKIGNIEIRRELAARMLAPEVKGGMHIGERRCN